MLDFAIVKLEALGQATDTLVIPTRFDGRVEVAGHRATATFQHPVGRQGPLKEIFQRQGGFISRVLLYLGGGTGPQCQYQAQ